jgi:hypothetical protein
MYVSQAATVSAPTKVQSSNPSNGALCSGAICARMIEYNVTAGNTQIAK